MKLRYRLVVYTVLVLGLTAFKIMQGGWGVSNLFAESGIFSDEPCPICLKMNPQWADK